MRGERGFALVITLIVTALLVALLVEFVNEVYVDTSHSHNFVAAQQASIIAESGIDGGIELLKISDRLRMGQRYSSLTEPWAKPFTYDTGAGTVTITIEEESGKFNLNSITSSKGITDEKTAVAQRLFKILKLSTDLTDAVLDWADENDTPLPGGAETSYYLALKAPYKAKNARLETVEELAMLKGFTPEIVVKLKPLVTVYPVEDQAIKVNVNTAPREVLQALDEKMTDDLVNRILDRRKSSPIKDGDLPSIPGLEAISPTTRAMISYAGSVYRIHAEGKVGESTSVAEAVVRTAGQTKPAILYWREY